MNNAKINVESVKIEMAKQPKLGSLQLLRGMSAFCIFLYHDIRTFPGSGKIYDFFSKPLGPLCVSVFLVLSGFVMTYSYWDRLLKSSLYERFVFALRKIRRLYPLHLIMLLIGTVRLMIRGKEMSELVKDLLLTIPLLQTWSPVRYQAINTVAWYLSATMFLYFMFPVLLPCFKKKKRSAALITIAVIIAIREIIGYFVFHFTSLDIKWLIYCFPLSRMVDFAAGGLLASIYMNQSEEESIRLPKDGFMPFVSILFCFISCVVFMRAHSVMPWFTSADLFLIPSLLLVFSLVSNEKKFSFLRTNVFLLQMAKLSPYLFLSHRLIIYCFHDLVRYYLGTDQIPRFLSVLIPLIISIVFVYSYLLTKKVMNDHFGDKSF